MKLVLSPVEGTGVKTHRLVSFLLIAYVLASPYDLAILVPALGGEVVEVPQLLLLVVGFLLIFVGLDFL